MEPALINTFTHLVSSGAEARIWDKGLFTWDAYGASATDIFSTARHEALLEGIEKSHRTLKRRSAAYFIRNLQGLQKARVVGDFLSELLCLDIETDGLGPAANITTAATYNGKDTHLYIQGVNMDELTRDLRRAKVIITFNGTRFDLPHLSRVYGWRGHYRHLDLLPVLKALGYRGSLAKIELARKIVRPLGLAKTGAEAVSLWKEWLAGDVRALRALLAYNAADAIGLLTLAVWAWLRSWDGYPKSVLPLRIEPVSQAYNRVLNKLVFDNGILPVVV